MSIYDMLSAVEVVAVSRWANRSSTTASRLLSIVASAAISSSGFATPVMVSTNHAAPFASGFTVATGCPCSSGWMIYLVFSILSTSASPLDR